MRGDDIDLLIGTRAGRALNLLPRELKLLDYLVRRPWRIVTRSILLATLVLGAGDRQP